MSDEILFAGFTTVETGNERARVKIGVRKDGAVVAKLTGPTHWEKLELTLYPYMAKYDLEQLLGMWKEGRTVSLTLTNDHYHAQSPVIGVLKLKSDETRVTFVLDGIEASDSSGLSRGHIDLS